METGAAAGCDRQYSICSIKIDLGERKGEKWPGEGKSRFDRRRSDAKNVVVVVYRKKVRKENWIWRRRRRRKNRLILKNCPANSDFCSLFSNFRYAHKKAHRSFWLFRPLSDWIDKHRKRKRRFFFALVALLFSVFFPLKNLDRDLFNAIDFDLVRVR